MTGPPSEVGEGGGVYGIRSASGRSRDQAASVAIPMALLATTAAFGPRAWAAPPSASIAQGSAPMHMLRTPSARPRIASSAVIITSALCIVEKPAMPSPTATSATSASGYQPDAANRQRNAIAKREPQTYDCPRVTGAPRAMISVPMIEPSPVALAKTPAQKALTPISSANSGTMGMNE